MRKINTEDVFKMARLLKHGNIIQNIKDAYAEGRKEGADTEQVGINAFMDILCSCSDAKVEDQFYDLLAGICEKKSDDIRTQSLETTIEDVKRICQENNIVNFFEICCQYEQQDVRIKDLIYRRYGGNAKSILAMPFIDGFELIEHAQDEEIEDKLYLRWAIAYQHVMGFEEFKNQIGTNRKQVKDNRTAEDILETVREIIG